MLALSGGKNEEKYFFYFSKRVCEFDLGMLKQLLIY